MNFNHAKIEFERVRTIIEQLLAKDGVNYNANGHGFVYDQARTMVDNFYGRNTVGEHRFIESINKAEAMKGVEHLKLNQLDEVIKMILTDVRLQESLTNEKTNQSKEVEKLQTKVADLTTENRLLKENFSTPVLELQEELKQVQADLDNADNKKARLQREIKEFETELKKERSQLGMYSETVENQERQRRNEINEKIKQRQNDLLLLQSEVNGFKADKGRIEQQIRADKKKPDTTDNAEITFVEDGKQVPFSEIADNYLIIKDENKSLRKTNESQNQKITEYSNLHESNTKEISRLNQLIHVQSKLGYGWQTYLGVKVVLLIFLTYVILTYHLIFESPFDKTVVGLLFFVMLFFFGGSFLKPKEILLQVLALILVIVSIFATIIITEMVKAN